MPSTIFSRDPKADTPQHPSVVADPIAFNSMDVWNTVLTLDSEKTTASNIALAPQVIFLDELHVRHAQRTAEQLPVVPHDRKELVVCVEKISCLCGSTSYPARRDDPVMCHGCLLEESVAVTDAFTSSFVPEVDEHDERESEADRDDTAAYLTYSSIGYNPLISPTWSTTSSLLERASYSTGRTTPDSVGEESESGSDQSDSEEGSDSDWLQWLGDDSDDDSDEYVEDSTGEPNHNQELESGYSEGSWPAPTHTGSPPITSCEFRAPQGGAISLTQIVAKRRGCIKSVDDVAWGDHALSIPEWIKIGLGALAKLEECVELRIRCDCTFVTHAQLAWRVAAYYAVFAQKDPERHVPLADLYLMGVSPVANVGSSGAL